MHAVKTKGHVRVLIVDDSHLLRRRLTELIGQLPGIEVVGSAPNVERGLQLIDELQPDVVTVDVRLPGRSGLSMVEEVAQRPSHPVIIVLTSYPEFRARALELGADYFVGKTSELYRLPQILESLRDVGVGNAPSG